VVAKLTGERPSKLIRGDLRRLDFDSAVMLKLYQHEREQEEARMKAMAHRTAQLTANAVLRAFAPVLGFKVMDESMSKTPFEKACQHKDWDRLASGELKCKRCGEVGT
jgi:hypothetical protein